MKKYDLFWPILAIWVVLFAFVTIYTMMWIHIVRELVKMNEICN